MQGGIAAGMIGIDPPAADALAMSVGLRKAPSIPEELQAGMIWSNVSIRVRTREETPASGSNDATKAHAFDLHTAFVKELPLLQIPAIALLHLFAYTRYRLYVNGHYAGRGPSRFQNQRPEYDTRDVTGLLRRGRNVLAILVHRDAPTGRVMHHDPGFAAVLEWRAQDGSSARMVTDTTWRARPDLSFGPRSRAWSSIEEHIDARRGEAWSETDFDASLWPAAIRVGGSDFRALHPRGTPLQFENLAPWHIHQQALPLILRAPAEIDFELPRIIQGYHEFEFDAEEASHFEVTYVLPDKQCSGTSTYIARCGKQTYLGGDTFAFKKLSLRLNSGTITLTKASAFEVRYPFERIGQFESSDPFLNQLWAICARSLEVLSEDAYVDCADRERVEWTDDSPPAFDCTRVMMAGPSPDGTKQWSDGRLLKALLRRIALTQQSDGQIKAHGSSERWDVHAIMEDRSCDWVILLREYFDGTGDKALVRELWPTVTRLLSWFLERRTKRGLVLAREWEVWDNPLRYQICEGAGLNALFYRALGDASYLAKAMGKRAASLSLSADAARLAECFNTLLWDPREGAYFGGLFGPGSKMAPQLDLPMFTGPIVEGHFHPTAQAALFALYSGIVPADRLQAVRNFVLAHQGEATGPMSHYYLFKALYAIDEEPLDARVLGLMRAGWKSQVESPWQTTWEDLADRGGSKIHVYGMVPGYFLSSFVLGVRRDAPVLERSIVIEPRPGGLSAARGVVVTEFGPVPMAWTRSEGGVMSVQCTIPSRVTATLRLRRRTDRLTLSVDGRAQQVKSEGAYLICSLPPGPHMVKHVE